MRSQTLGIRRRMKDVKHRKLHVGVVWDHESLASIAKCAAGARCRATGVRWCTSVPHIRSR